MARPISTRYASLPRPTRVESNLVTDPYSVALTTNSTRSVMANLDDPSLAPDGWRHLGKPAFRSSETH